MLTFKEIGIIVFIFLVILFAWAILYKGKTKKSGGGVPA